MESVTNGPLAQSAKGKTATSPETPSEPAGTGQPLSRYHSYFSSLLSWENPRASAIAYVAIVSTIIALRYLDLFRYGLKMTWMALGITVLAEVTGKVLMNNGFATAFRPRKYITISEDNLTAMTNDVHELLNFFLVEAQRILFAENVPASAGAFVAAFISYYLVKIVPYWALALIAVTTAFFVPLVYISNQELIDKQLEQAGDMIDAQTRHIREVSEEHIAHATEVGKQYLGDCTSKAQAMLRGQSASPEAVAKKDIKDADFPAVPEGEIKTAAAKVKEEEEPLLG